MSFCAFAELVSTFIFLSASCLVLNGTTPEYQHRNRGPFKDFSILLKSSKNFTGEKFHLEEEVGGVQLFGIIWGKSCNFELNKNGKGNIKRGVAAGGIFYGHNAGTD